MRGNTNGSRWESVAKKRDSEYRVQEAKGRREQMWKKKLEENHIFGETKNIVDIVHVVRQRLKETGVGSGRT